MLKQITIALLFAACLTSQTSSPELPARTVDGNTITSTHDPALRIQLPPTAKYVGADRWILYGIADCELHAFVQADPNKTVQRLYWIQFEGYLPSKPDLHHTYDSPRHSTIGGLDVFIDTWVKPVREHITPGSDLEHIETLLETHGYKLPPEMMSVRLVHLLDQQKRKELMIIYSEDIAPTGFTATDLTTGGRAHSQWPNIETSLIDRAEKSIAILPLPNP